MTGKEAARGSCNYDRAMGVSRTGDTHILPDYERGTRWAGYVLAAVFVLLGIGAVVLGW